MQIEPNELNVDRLTGQLRLVSDIALFVIMGVPSIDITVVQRSRRYRIVMKDNEKDGEEERVYIQWMHHAIKE